MDNEIPKAQTYLPDFGSTVKNNEFINFTKVASRAFKFLFTSQSHNALFQRCSYCVPI